MTMGVPLSSFVTEIVKGVLYSLIDKVGIEGVTIVLLMHKDRDKAYAIVKAMMAVPGEG